MKIKPPGPAQSVKSRSLLSPAQWRPVTPGFGLALQALFEPGDLEPVDLVDFSERWEALFPMALLSWGIASGVEPPPDAENLEAWQDLAENTMPRIRALVESRDHALACYVAEMIETLTAYEHPADLHHAAARLALERCPGAPSDKAAVRELGAALCDALRDMEAACGLTRGQAPADWRPGDPAWPDMRFAAFLRGFGAAGELHAAEVEAKAAELAGADHVARWRLWVDFDFSPFIGRFAVRLGMVLWLDVINPARSAPQYAVRAVVASSGDAYVKVEKLANTAAWAAGGAGRRIDTRTSPYAGVPEIARYVTRSTAVLPAGARPHQLSLPVEVTDNEVTPFGARAVGDTQFVLSPYDGKAFLWLLATSDPSGELSRGTVDSVTRALNPGKQRVRARDYEATALAMRNLRRLGIVLPDNTDVQVFDIRVPRLDGEVLAEQPIVWGLSRTFQDAAQQAKPWRGQFMLNLTGAMRLSANEAALLRAYVFAAATWNDAHRVRRGKPSEFRAELVPTFTAEEWAAATNSLSDAALEYLRENDKRKRTKLCDDRRKAYKNLEALADYGLVVITKGVGRDRFRVEPPAEFIDAYQDWREGGPRPLADDE